MDLSIQKLIFYLFLTSFLSQDINCNSVSELATNTSSESTDYNNIEKIDLSEPFDSQSPQEYPFYGSPQEDIDYQEIQEPRNRYKETIYPYTSYHGYNEPLPNQIRGYMKNPHQPYYLPSDHIESYAPKPMASSMMENQIKQQPLYANLMWRKIIYPPYPSYSPQSSNQEIIISDSSFDGLQTDESVVNRRFQPRSPYRRYYTIRRRYPMPRSGNKRRQMVSYYPISMRSPSRQQTVKYNTNPVYQRKRKVPINQYNNYNTNRNVINPQ